MPRNADLLLFDIVHSAEFDEDCALIFGNTPRGDEVLRAATWGIAHAANLKEAVAKGVYYWPIFPFDGFCYLFFYGIEGKRVTMLRIRKESTPVSPSLLNDLDFEGEQ